MSGHDCNCKSGRARTDALSLAIHSYGPGVEYAKADRAVSTTKDILDRAQAFYDFIQADAKAETAAAPRTMELPPLPDADNLTDDQRRAARRLFMFSAPLSAAFEHLAERHVAALEFAGYRTGYDVVQVTRAEVARAILNDAGVNYVEQRLKRLGLKFGMRGEEISAWVENGDDGSADPGETPTA